MQDRNNQTLAALPTELSRLGILGEYQVDGDGGLSDLPRVRALLSAVPAMQADVFQGGAQQSGLAHLSGEWRGGCGGSSRDRLDQPMGGSAM